MRADADASVPLARTGVDDRERERRLPLLVDWRLSTPIAVSRLTLLLDRRPTAGNDAMNDRILSRLPDGAAACCASLLRRLTAVFQNAIKHT